ncbi:MAG TPA: NADH-quinone oxidoreductase subunit M, partial [Thermoanaerobaculia bacterium]
MDFLYLNQNVPILSLITFVPLIGALFIVFFLKNPAAIKRAALAVAIVDFILSIPLWLYFDPKGSGAKLFQFKERFDWIPSLGVQYHFGIDGIALLLILLTTLVGVIAIYSSFAAIDHRQKEYYVLLLLLQTGMIGTFCALDFFLFYVFWEVMLVPMYFIIGIWG